MIPQAIDTIRSVGITAGTEVQSEYNGYIASFGASITRSGLLPAVIFFENEESDTNAKRHLIPKAILQLISPNTEGKLSEYILKKSKSNREMMREISDAAVALKIALRTYKILK